MQQKILIIDSDKNDREELKRILSDKYDVLEADKSDDAISIMNKENDKLSLILMNMNIPSVDRFELLGKRYTNSALMSIPAVIIIDGDNQDVKINSLVMGANDFIISPYTQDDILASVKKNIELSCTRKEFNVMQYDNITGIYKRESFIDIATDMISKHEPGYYVIGCFDIDNFKIINDQYGLSIGDQVLRHVANSIDKCVKKIGGICCRITADNFAVLYPVSYIDSDEIKLTHSETTSPACIAHKIKIHIGRYIIDDPSIPVSLMFDRASMAANSIKGKYDSYVASFSDSMRLELLHEQQIINDMYDALESGQFVPWFQPQYNHATGALIGAEALVRWKKDNKFISPAEFVPIFERNGFIYEMDQYIWEQTCIILRRWINEGRAPLPVSVNISRCDVFHKHFVDVISGIVDKYNIPYNLIRLEITESAFSQSTNQITEKITQLINLGFTVEIDDFGSGYSSLNTLKDVPASILKLDMKFFENTPNTQRSGNIIESVVRMAKWLGMSVIAEGVEEKEQADYLKSIGCCYIQGYFYAKPMPVEEYQKLLDSCSIKEHELIRMKTLDTLNNNEFWNPKSMETLIFNSYIGGACIFEYDTISKRTELLRTNDQYLHELGRFGSGKSSLFDNKTVMNLNEINQQKMLANIQRAIETNKESSIELLLTDNEMNTEYIRTTVRAIAQTYDRYLFYCVVVNLTEQRNAEKRELEYAQQLKVIMDNVQGGVSAIVVYDDGTSKKIFNNEKYYELYGYTKEEAEAENLDILKLIIPEDLPEILEKIKKLKQNKKPITLSYRCIKRDGKITYLRANSSLMHIQGYGDEVITSVITDITQEKNTSERLELLTNNIPGGIAKFRITPTVIKPLYLSDGFYKLTGYSKQEYDNITQKDPLYILYKKDVNIFYESFHSVIHHRDTIDITFRIKVKNGDLRWVNLRGSLGEIRGNIAIIDTVLFDINERKLAEDKVKAEQDKARLSYERELNLRKEMIKDSHVSLVMNLTTGFIEEYTSKVSCIPSANVVGLTGDQHCQQLIKQVNPKDIPKVRNTIFPDKLLEAYNRNETNLSVEFRRKTDRDQYHWVRSNITIAKRPDSGEIIAFLYINDIDMQTKNQMAIKSILDKEIESAGILNVKSGLQHLINVHDQRYYIEINKEFDHDQMLMQLIDNSVVDEDKERCRRSLMSQKIKEKLDTDGKLTITFRVKGIDGTIKIKQSAAFYLDASHEEIVLSNRDITHISDENSSF